MKGARVDREIPGAPSVQEAREYAQRMREVRELTNGERPRSRQRKGPSQRTSSNRRQLAFELPEEAERNQAEASRLDGERDWQESRRRPTRDTSRPRSDEPRQTDQDIAREAGRRLSEEMREKTGGRRAGDAVSEEAHVRPPRRRKNTAEHVKRPAPKLSTAKVVLVAAATSAVVAMGTSSIGESLAGLVGAGWWL